MQQIQVESQCHILLLCQPEELRVIQVSVEVFSMKARFGSWAAAHNVVITLATKFTFSYGHKKELQVAEGQIQWFFQCAASFTAATKICHLHRAGRSRRSVQSMKRKVRELLVNWLFIPVSCWYQRSWILPNYEGHLCREDTLLKVILWTFSTHLLLKRTLKNVSCWIVLHLWMDTRLFLG